MARNGPTSLPVGETTPIAPARMSSGSQLVNAKTTPGEDHQDRAGDQHPAAAEPVGVGRQPQRDDRVADERQGQDEADGQRVEADRGQVQDEDDREEPVAEHPQRPHREQQPAVPVEPAQARDEAGIDAGAGRSRRRSLGRGSAVPECRRRYDTTR